MLKYLDDPDGKSKQNQEREADAGLSEVNENDADLPLTEDTEDSEVAVDVPEVFGRPDIIATNDEDEQVTILKQRLISMEHRVGYLERIVKVSQMLNSTLSVEPLLQIIVQAATELTSTEACSIMLIDKRTGELRFAEATGGVTDNLKEISVPLENSIGGYVIRKKRPLLIRDVKNDPHWHGETMDFDTRSILGVPLTVRDNVIGVLEVINKTAESGFGENDIQIATTLASQAAIAIENARLLDELQEAYREQAEVDQIKNNFVSIASHELRTPLAVILGYATFIKDNVEGETSEQLDIVLNSAVKLRSLIDDMVNLRHIQAGDIHLERSIFSLKQLILDITNEFSELIASKKITLTTRFVPNDSVLNIDADRQKIYLVIANLVNNAVKFTAEDGRIHINVQLKEHKYWIDVIDTGIGIPKSEYDRIFGQFSQVEPALTRKYQGLGLGLSIAKGMVEEHKGKIWVESVVGKGSKFVVTLPTAPDVAEM